VQFYVTRENKEMWKEMFRERREEMGKPRPGGGVSMF